MARGQDCTVYIHSFLASPSVFVLFGVFSLVYAPYLHILLVFHTI
jgi:hypothetical protein